MNLSEYNEMVLKTRKYPNENKIIYPVLKLAGETGELLEKITSNGNRSDTIKEIGDIA